MVDPLVRLAKVLQTHLAKRDPWTYFRSYQVHANCPRCSLWDDAFEQRVRQTQHRLMRDEAYLVRLLDFLVNKVRRAWTPFSLYKAVSAKAGEAALHLCVADQK